MCREDAAELEDRRFRAEQRKQWDCESRIACQARRDEVLSDPQAFEFSPAWDLQCCGLPTDPEDTEEAWCRRWALAGERVAWAEAAGAFRDDKGGLHMIAMVTSPIWKELGKMGWGRADFDTPPFSPGSVWSWQSAGRDKLLGFELMDEKTLDAYLEARLAKMSATRWDKGIVEALKKLTPEEQDQLQKELEAIVADHKETYRRANPQ